MITVADIGMKLVATNPTADVMKINQQNQEINKTSYEIMFFKDFFSYLFFFETVQATGDISNQRKESEVEIGQKLDSFPVETPFACHRLPIRSRRPLSSFAFSLFASSSFLDSFWIPIPSSSANRSPFYKGQRGGWLYSNTLWYFASDQTFWVSLFKRTLL